MYNWCFEGQGTAKVKCYSFSSYKKRKKMWLVCLGGKLGDDSYGWCIFRLKCQKTVEIRYLEKNKQERRYRLYF